MTTMTARRTLLIETRGKSVAVLHDTDPDGYGAGWAISKFLPEASFFPVLHGQPDFGSVLKQFPEVADFDHIIVTDLSFDRNTTLMLANIYESATVIDHHATAKRAIGDLDGVFIDTTQSAAMLAWKFFKPIGLCPRITEYIQDYDIWKHELPFTHEISSLIQSSMNEPSFDKLDEIDHMLNGDSFDNTVELGAAALDYRRSMGDLSAKQARRIEFDGYYVPCVNVSLPPLISDVGHLLDDNEAFSMSWFQQADGSFKYSLRSRYGSQNQAVDVSEIALKNGGGGHSSASGFVVDKIKHRQIQDR
ncbi:hypothetical protein KAR91_49870 [Candidatus Pacearchaeota archaeon]|nr:hypothetical protein [Candidatus Pacearchaeota archaeon]